MKLCVVIFCVVSISSVAFYTNAKTSDLLRVTLPNGFSKLIGRYMRSYDGRGIRAFLGIPYAEPPIGDLRFRVSC